jgi:tRNA threonylcarbamoyladenosine modification (KEOPS) complex Cgi121 subunit
MRQYSELVGKYVEATGFSGIEVAYSVKLVQRLRQLKAPKVALQVFDDRLVATWEHLYFAVLNAYLAFMEKQNISRSVEVETMLYASAQRQIRKALEVFGVKTGASSLALVLAGSADDVAVTLQKVAAFLHAEPNEALLELTEEKARNIRIVFGVTALELETRCRKNPHRALVDAVVERMALLPAKV